MLHLVLIVLQLCSIDVQNALLWMPATFSYYSHFLTPLSFVCCFQICLWFSSSYFKWLDCRLHYRHASINCNVTLNQRSAVFCNGMAVWVNCGSSVALMWWLKVLTALVIFQTALEEEGVMLEAILCTHKHWWVQLPVVWEEVDIPSRADYKAYMLSNQNGPMLY